MPVRLTCDNCAASGDHPQRWHFHTLDGITAAFCPTCHDTLGYDGKLQAWESEEMELWAAGRVRHYAAAEAALIAEMDAWAAAHPQPEPPDWDEITRTVRARTVAKENK